jgi:hypothetical protein
MASGIQFRGMDHVMAAYDNNKIIAWAVLYGKLINAKYIGINQHEAREALRIFLTQLKMSDTTAVYTLNLYEDLPKNAKIKASTEPDLAYNFIVVDAEAPRHARYAEITQINSDLQNRITALEARLAIADEDDDDDEDENSVGGIVSGLFKDPRVQEWIKTKAIGLADKFLAGQPAKILPMQTSQAAKVGAVTSDDPILINEDQQDKCNQALEILVRCDPSLGDNLMKIAKIAENDPGKYQMFSKML